MRLWPLLALLCGACSAPTPVLYKPDIAASLLLPCVDPVLAPDLPTDNELAAERVRIAKAYIDCRDKHAALADRVK